MTHNEYKSVSWLTMNPSQLSPALFWTNLPQKVLLSFGRYCSNEVARPPEKGFATCCQEKNVLILVHCQISSCNHVTTRNTSVFRTQYLKSCQKDPALNLTNRIEHRKDMIAKKYLIR